MDPILYLIYWNYRGVFHQDQDTTGAPKARDTFW